MREGLGEAPLPPHLAQEAPPRPENPMKEAILLAACSEFEILPQNPDLPADVFTACLTTPIKVRVLASNPVPPPTCDSGPFRPFHAVVAAARNACLALCPCGGVPSSRGLRACCPCCPQSVP